MTGLRLAIELSTRTGSVALATDGRVLERRLERARAHASDLLPNVDELARALGVDGVGGHLEAILVGTGPGSYTGLRVALATALGLARGTGASLRGVPSFEALVYGSLDVGEEALVAMDARAGAYYCGHYRRDEDDVVVLEPAAAVSERTLRARATACAPNTTLLATTELVRGLELDARGHLQVRDDTTPRAEALLALGATRLLRLGAQRAHEIEPLYLRAFGERPH